MVVAIDAMDTEPKDSIATIAAVGLLAYASADIAHHVFGHGAACLVLGGQIISLSSIFVNCSLRGTAIDLAGPFANLVIGLVALLAARIAIRASSTTRLFSILAAAFNLMWFALQLAHSAATRIDDWAWAMQQIHVTNPVRYGMIAVGLLAYFFIVRAVAGLMASFAHPPARVRTIVLTAWITAGMLACVTAAFDHHAGVAILRSAAPQSLLLSIGLLFVSGKAARTPYSGGRADALVVSVPWIAAATIVGAASILLLGPGIAITL